VIQYWRSSGYLSGCARWRWRARCGGERGGYRQTKGVGGREATRGSTFQPAGGEGEGACAKASLAGECTHVLHVAHAVEGLVAVDVRVSEHVHVSPEPPAHPPPRRGDSPSTPQLQKGGGGASPAARAGMPAVYIAAGGCSGGGGGAHLSWRSSPPETLTRPSSLNTSCWRGGSSSSRGRKCEKLRGHTRPDRTRARVTCGDWSSW
jgi:hypothetical protein